jgi:hypothetical protein
MAKRIKQFNETLINEYDRSILLVYVYPIIIDNNDFYKKVKYVLLLDNIVKDQNLFH